MSHLGLSSAIIHGRARGAKLGRGGENSGSNFGARSLVETAAPFPCERRLWYRPFSDLALCLFERFGMLVECRALNGFDPVRRFPPFLRSKSNVSYDATEAVLPFMC